MTSMPASRRARAMTLAPRSWPSRPGLAINTRIFFSVICALIPLLCVLCDLCVESGLLALAWHYEPSNTFFPDRHIEIDQQSEFVAGETQICEHNRFLNWPQALR